MDALSALYPELSIGGYVIIDDFYIPAGVTTTEDYRAANSITEPIQDIDEHDVILAAGELIVTTPITAWRHNRPGTSSNQRRPGR